VLALPYVMKTVSVENERNWGMAIRRGILNTLIAAACS
jgi:hypothetical protein